MYENKITIYTLQENLPSQKFLNRCQNVTAGKYTCYKEVNKKEVMKKSILIIDKCTCVVSVCALIFCCCWKIH